ncbi:MAG: hypothetical protein DRO88_11950 [Promethearchaeia archaeon]|nr:MAG: hypothetical protein DRO88_11950 [Candidatus Lokiarchaeia archaeon]
MILPVYESNSVRVPPNSTTNIFQYDAVDSTAMLESFSFFCSDERAYEVWVNILVGNAKLKPFNLLKGIRSDSKANLFIRNQDNLKIVLENKSQVELNVDMQLTLRRYD